MTRNRSSLLIALGAAVFVIGTSLALIALRGGGNDKSTAKVNTAATAPASKPGDVVANGSSVPSFEIPTGKVALAVSLPYVQGVAGFVKAHDKVDLFGTVKPGSPPPKTSLTPPPVAKLILSNVEVLFVSAPSAGSNATAVSPSTTFVLALSPADAEQVVYFQTFEGMYMSLARTDQGLVSTPGRAAGAPF